MNIRFFLAQDQNATFTNPISMSLPDFLKKLVEELLELAYVLAPFIILYAAITIITSEGEPSKIKEGKKIIFWTAFAIALLKGGEMLLNVLISAFKGLFPQ